MGYNIFFGFDPLCSQINLDILMFYIKVFMLEKSKCKCNLYIKSWSKQLFFSTKYKNKVV
jgi:hypothetical protein